MVKGQSGRIGCGLLLLLLAQVRAAPLPREPGTPRAARDDSGVVWSISADDAAILSRWNGQRWQKTGFSPAVDAELINLWSRADGSVVALWNGNKKDSTGNRIRTDEYFVSVHRGALSRRTGQFHLSSPIETDNSGATGKGEGRITTSCKPSRGHRDIAGL